MTNNNLPLPDSGIVEYIIHISDIHIRIGDETRSRYTEYLAVFKNLYAKLRTLDTVQKKTCVIIITGDIFETKNRAETYSVSLFNELIHSLSEIAPVYIIQGNHDYRQDQPEAPDMITSFLHKNQNKRVFYMDRTGVYTVDDVGFGLVSVKDTLKPASTCGRVDDLPKFPAVDAPTKIALFHGTVTNSRMENGAKSRVEYPVEWFKGYDMVLLGDIHLQQIHGVKLENGIYTWTNTMPYGYPGSLVQQHWNEPLYGHGFLLWNIRNKTVVPYHIKNPHGLLSLRYTATGWVDPEKTPLGTILENADLPDILHVKVKGDYKAADVSALHETVQKHAKICKIHAELVCNGNATTVTDSTENIVDYNSPKIWTKYIEECTVPKKMDDVPWKTWLSNPQTLTISKKMVPEDLHEDVAQRNAKITKLGNALQDEITDHQTKVQKSALSLDYMQWQWILPYRNKNWFNFRDMSKKICAINAKNNCGKSSFFEIIVLALYGEPMTSRSNKGYTGSIICTQKPPSEMSFVKLDFYIGDKKYQIFRSFEAKDQKKLSTKRNELYSVKNGVFTPVVIDSSTALNTWIRQNIGDMDSFLLSCMLTQYSDGEFFSLPSRKQKEILDRALFLSSLVNLDDLLKETSNSYTYVLTKMRHRYDAVMAKIGDYNRELYEKTAAKTVQTQFELEKLEAEYDAIQESWFHLKHDDLELDDDIIVANRKKYKKLLAKYAAQCVDDLLQKKGALDAEFAELADYYDADDVPSAPPDTVDRPAFDATALKTEYAALKLRKQKCLPREITHTETEYADLLDVYKHEWTELLDAKPAQPQSSRSEHTTWKNIYDNLVAKITTEYGSPKKLQKYCENNPSVVPSISEATLAALQSQIAAEKGKVKNSCVLEFDDAELAELVVEATNRAQEAQSVADTIAVLEQSVEEKRAKWDEAVERLAEYKNTHQYRRPKSSIEECMQWHAEYAEMTLKYAEMAAQAELLKARDLRERQLEKLTVQHSECAQRIAVLQRNPYNPDCAACQQQCWKHELDELIKNCADYEAEIVAVSAVLELDKCDVGSSCRADLDATTEWLEKYNILDSRSAYWQTQKAEWSTYSEYVGLLEKYEQDCQKYQAEWLADDKQLKQHTLSAKKSEKARQKYSDAVYVYENKDRWTQIEETINRELRVLENSAKINTAHQILAEYQERAREKETWNRELEIILAHEKWHSHRETLDEKIRDASLDLEYAKTCLADQNYKSRKQELEKWKEYEKALKSWKAGINRAEYAKNEALIAAQSKRVDYERKYEYWKMVAELKPQYLDKKALRERVGELRKTLYALKGENERLSLLDAEHKKTGKTAATLLEMTEKLRDYKEAVDFITNNMKRYRMWLYSKIILPKLTAHVNGIVQKIAGSKVGELVGEIDTTEREFDWFVSDGKCKTVMEKQGGFIRFMYGLAMRIALSCMGAASIPCRQIFIDEGFVFADADNLEKIPDFIESLLCVYDSVLLVSHLDTIKECSHVNAKIERSANNLSLLQFGKTSDIVAQKTATVSAACDKKDADLDTEIEEFFDEAKQKNQCKKMVGNKANLRQCKALVKKGDYCARHQTETAANTI